MAKTKVDAMWEDLKSKGYFQSDKATFDKYFYAPGEQGYKNRKALYDDLHNKGYLQSPTYEDFAQQIGLHATGNAGTASAHGTALSQLPADVVERRVRTAKPPTPLNKSKARRALQQQQQAIENQQQRWQQQSDRQQRYVQQRTSSLPGGMERIEERAKEHLATGKAAPVPVAPNPEVVRGDMVMGDGGRLHQSYQVGSDLYSSRAGAEADLYRQAHPVEDELQQAYLERERLQQEMNRAGTDAYNAYVGSGSAFMPQSAQGAAMYNSPEFSMLSTAYHQNEQRIKTLERERDADGFWRTVGKELFSLDTWDFGASEFMDASALMRYGQGDNLTPEQEDARESMLLNTFKRQGADQQYGQNDTFKQRAATITAQAIPFVAQFLATGGMEGITAAGGKLGGKMAAKWATGRVGEWILKNTGVLAGDMAAGFAMANTVGALTTGADIMSRHQGQVVMGPDGTYRFEGGKSWRRSIYEGEVANTLEYYTEMLGTHIDGVGGMLGSWLSKTKAGQRLGTTELSRLFSRIKGSEFYNATSHMLRSGGFNGYPGEVLEEEANLVLNALLVGDNKWSDLVDKDTQLDIVGGMLLSVGFMQTPGIVGGSYQAAQYYRYKHATDVADQTARARLGDERWDALKSGLDEATNKEVVEILGTVLADESLPTFGKRAVADYVTNLLKMRGYNLRTMADAKDKVDNPEQADDQQADTNDAFHEGYNAPDEEQEDIGNRMNEASQRLTAMGYSDEDLGRLDRGEYDTAFLNSLPDDQRIAVLDYLNAKAALDGTIQHSQDEIENAVARSDAQVDRQTHKDTGMLHRATLKPQGENGAGQEVYVIGGQLVMTGDGTMVDAEASDDSLFAYNPATGEIEQYSTNDFESVDDPVNPEQLKTEAADNIRQAMAQQIAARINGDVQAGGTYDMMDGQGNTMRGTVLEVTDDDTAMVQMEGTQQPIALPLQHVQSWVDNAKQVRMSAGPVQQQAQQEPAQSAGPRDNAAPVVPSAPAQAPEQNKATESKPLPMDEKTGEPVWSKTTPEEGYSYLTQSGLTGEDIASLIDDRIAQADAAIAKVSKGGTIDERLAARQAKNYWEAVKALNDAAAAAAAETAAQQSTEQAVAPVAENEMQPVEEPTADNGGTAHGVAGEEQAAEPEAEPSAAEKRANALRERAARWGDFLGVPVEVFVNVEDIEDEAVREAIRQGQAVRAWFLPSTGKVGVYLPNIASGYDMDIQIMHEVVGHHGMRKLFGDAALLKKSQEDRKLYRDNPDMYRQLCEEEYGKFCDRVFDELMTEKEREHFLGYAGVNGNQRAAADEFIAWMINREGGLNERERTRLQQILDWLRGVINNLLREVNATADERHELTRDDVMELLRASMKNLEETAKERLSVSREGLVTDMNGDARYSVRYLPDERQREKLRDGIMRNTGVSRRKAERYLESETSLAAMIMGNPDVLDYSSDARYKAIKNNSDYPQGGKRFSVDSAVAEAERMTETNPTDGQKESGNYKKGHVKVDGFDISIEQPKGSVRSGVDADGKAWSQEMHNTYGYIRGTEGVDGDHIDVFLSDHLDDWNGNVYVVDQVNKDRSFDEHKVLYGFNSEQEARDAYLSNYEEGWTGLGNITGVSREEFKKWVDSSHRKNKPFAEYKNVKPLQSDGTGDRARFSISERTDDEGNEVYTETREDGTKDREVVTMPDGSRDVTWFDEAGRKKETLSYYPNGEVRQVSNYDSDGELTRQIQYDENRRAIRHWEPRIGTDWERDENGVARGMSNGVEMIRYSLSDEEREAQTHSENFKRWFGDWENDPENASKVVDENGEPKVVLHGTPNGEFYVFDPEKAGSNTDQGWLGTGFYFYGNAPEYASQYAGKNGRVVQVYLDIKNPYIASVDEFNRLAEANDPEMSRRFREQLEDEGYDGVYYNGDLNEEWVAFRPEQIKSATENNGDFSRENPDIRYSVGDTFYSNAAKAVEGVKQGKAKAEQWKAMLTKAGGIKAGEDKWMGLTAWLDEHKGETLTKGEVLEFVRQNGVQMEEVGYSEAPDTFESLKREYDQWLHDEGFDYAQEQLRERFGDDADIAFDDLGGELVVANEEAAAAVLGSENIINSTRLDYTTDGLENKREIAFVVPDVEPYQENDVIHFGPENQGRAVMWVRFGETRDADGNRVLVIDEIQSNRHQEGREKGYADHKAVKAYNEWVDAKAKEFGVQRHQVAARLSDKEYFKMMELADAAKRFEDVVPAAPFEKNWHEVAMKRMLRLAAEEGFDKVAWTTGEQQAERYDIGKRVDKIEVHDLYDGLHEVQGFKDGKAVFSQETENGEQGLAELLGKEMARKAYSNLHEGETDYTDENGRVGFTGDNLQIGGEGMKGFYDQILPRFMDKYGKRWGVKVGEVTLDTPGKETMHSVDVTPEMRRSVLEHGQPLFSVAEEDQKLFDGAKRKFGVTSDIREAGYVLPDGTMLDFSGRHELDPGTDSSFLKGRRATDHRAISQISFVYDENGDEVDTGLKTDMPDFIKRGAIRIDDNAGSVNLSTPPTAAQRKVLRELIRRNGGDVQVDFGDGWDSDHYAEYEEAKPARVLADIDRYFDEGIKPEGNVRFSIGDGSPRDVAVARDQYERMLRRSGFQFQEAMQDSMLSLKRLYQAVLGKNTRIEDVADNENAYLAENAMSSINAAEQHEYFTRLMKPLLAVVYNLAGKSKEERQRLTDYMMAKHGLERNLVLADRDAQDTAAAGGDYQQAYADNRKKDYSGLTALTGESDVAAAEAAAQQMVDDYERDHDTTELWSRVKAATGATLYKMYSSGLMSKATYDKTVQMFEYYIPLRGWDETTSDEVYGYLTDKSGPLGSPIKHARGRSSKADDPIATIALMADDTIRAGNRNLMKQRFLIFVQNHPSDLVSVNRLWLQYNDVTDEWEPVFADIEADDSPEQVAQKVEAFEAKMEQLASSSPDKYKRGRDAVNIPYKVVMNNLGEHQILVKRGGETFVLTVNGSPRAAQALNGMTNPDVKIDNASISSLVEGAQWLNREFSAFYTTRNPDFIVSNFLRDTLYSNCMTWVKESPNYALKFHKNFGRFNPAMLLRLFQKWENGTLDMNNQTEAMFYQFMVNGGETGYTNVKDIEGHKRTIVKELKRQGNPILKGWHLLGEEFDVLNRSVENCARFAAFVTSREMGRSIGRSIYDAKEVSVNFNKKGAGDKFANAVDQTRIGRLGSRISGYGRLFYIFWNASVQGMTNTGRAFKRHPVKAMLGLSSMYALGSAVALLAQAMGGDGDDKDYYYNLPENVRRSNICFRLGSKMPWITIPLPIEFRAVYGLGEMFVGVLTGKERYSDSELAYNIISQLSQLMPIDLTEGEGGWANLMPQFLKMPLEVATNKTWYGLPIYKDTPYNKDMPEWTKAYSSANETIVSITRKLNELTGGNDYKKGWFDGWWNNPAVIEYALKSIFGGVSTTIMNLQASYNMAFNDKEFNWRNIPIANRVIKNGDERTAFRKAKNEYFNFKKEAEETKRLLNDYQKDTSDPMKYAQLLNMLHYSPEYGRYLVFESYNERVEDLRKAAKEGKAPANAEELENEAIRDLVDAMHSYDSSALGKGLASGDKDALRKAYDSDSTLRRAVGKELAKQAGLSDEKFNKDPQSESERGIRSHKAYESQRHGFDLAEDIVLESEQKRAKGSGDEQRADAIGAIRRELNKIITGKDATKTKDEIIGLGQGDDERIMNELRAARKQVLEDLKNGDAEQAYRNLERRTMRLGLRKKAKE